MRMANAFIPVAASLVAVGLAAFNPEVTVRHAWMMPVLGLLTVATLVGLLLTRGEQR